VSFEPERRRVADAVGPGVISGINQATVGNGRIYRNSCESQDDFIKRAYRLARRAGVRVASIEGLLVVDGGRNDQ